MFHTWGLFVIKARTELFYRPHPIGGNLCILYLYLYFNWQNVLGTHHASAHGGSSDLIVKMLD